MPFPQLCWVVLSGSLARLHTIRQLKRMNGGGPKPHLTEAETALTPSKRRAMLAAPRLDRPTTMNNSSSLRVGVVGMGFGRHVLVPAFRADTRCEVSMVCASSQATANEAARALGVQHATDDWREVATNDAVDIVAIAVPPLLQPDIALTALEAGKHVFCEKPLATSAVDAERLLAVARQSGRAHALDFEFPELRSWQHARKVLGNEHILGKLRHVYVRWHVETRAYKLRETGSWKVRASDGGGSLLNFGTHVLHYVEWLLGRIRRVSARFAPNLDEDARLDAWLELDDATPVTVSVATDAPFTTGHSVDVYGEHGRLTLENTTVAAAANFVLTLATRDGGVKVVVDERQPDRGESRIEPVAALIRRFVDSIVKGAPVAFPDFLAGARVACLVDALRRSATHASGVDV